VGCASDGGPDAVFRSQSTARSQAGSAPVSTRRSTTSELPVPPCSANAGREQGATYAPGANHKVVRRVAGIKDNTDAAEIRQPSTWWDYKLFFNGERCACALSKNYRRYPTREIHASTAQFGESDGSVVAHVLGALSCSIIPSAAAICFVL
jgi:hypothetical protein